MKEILMHFEEISNNEGSSTNSKVALCDVDIKKLSKEIEDLKKEGHIKNGDAIDEIQKAIGQFEELSEAKISITRLKK